MTYDRQYRYNRNISGRLNLREELYRDILKIEHGDILVVVVLEKNEIGNKYFQFLMKRQMLGCHSELQYKIQQDFVQFRNTD